MINIFNIVSKVFVQRMNVHFQPLFIHRGKNY